MMEKLGARLDTVDTRLEEVLDVEKSLQADLHQQHTATAELSSRELERRLEMERREGEARVELELAAFQAAQAEEAPMKAAVLDERKPNASRSALLHEAARRTVDQVVDSKDCAVPGYTWRQEESRDQATECTPRSGHDQGSDAQPVVVARGVDARGVDQATQSFQAAKATQGTQSSEFQGKSTGTQLTPDKAAVRNSATSPPRTATVNASVQIEPDCHAAETQCEPDPRVASLLSQIGELQAQGERDVHNSIHQGCMEVEDVRAKAARDLATAKADVAVAHAEKERAVEAAQSVGRLESEALREAWEQEMAAVQRQAEQKVARVLAQGKKESEALRLAWDREVGEARQGAQGSEELMRQRVERERGEKEHLERRIETMQMERRLDDERQASLLHKAQTQATAREEENAALRLALAELRTASLVERDSLQEKIAEVTRQCLDEKNLEELKIVALKEEKRVDQEKQEWCQHRESERQQERAEREAERKSAQELLEQQRLHQDKLRQRLVEIEAEREAERAADLKDLEQEREYRKQERERDRATLQEEKDERRKERRAAEEERLGWEAEREKERLEDESKRRLVLEEKGRVQKVLHRHFDADSRHFDAGSRHFNADSRHFNADSGHCNAGSRHFHADSRHFHPKVLQVKEEIITVLEDNLVDATNAVEAEKRRRAQEREVLTQALAECEDDLEASLEEIEAWKEQLPPLEAALEETKLQLRQESVAKMETVRDLEERMSDVQQEGQAVQQATQAESESRIKELAARNAKLMEERDVEQRRAELSERQLIAAQGELIAAEGHGKVLQEQLAAREREGDQLRKQSLVDRDRSVQDVAWAEEIQAEATRKLEDGRAKFDAVKQRLEESQQRRDQVEGQLAGLEAEKAAMLKQHADEVTWMRNEAIMAVQAVREEAAAQHVAWGQKASASVSASQQERHSLMAQLTKATAGWKECQSLEHQAQDMATQVHAAVRSARLDGNRTLAVLEHLLRWKERLAGDFPLEVEVARLPLPNNDDPIKEPPKDATSYLRNVLQEGTMLQQEAFQVQEVATGLRHEWAKLQVIAQAKLHADAEIRATNLLAAEHDAKSRKQRAAHGNPGLRPL